MVEPETLRIIVLLAPGNRFAIDVDADISAGETPAAEIIIAQPMRPAAATGTDVEDVGFGVGQAFGEHEHPEIARVHQEVGLVVENAVADANADAQVIGRQVAEFRPDQARQHVECVDRGLEKRIERQP